MPHVKTSVNLESSFEKLKIEYLMSKNDRAISQTMFGDTPTPMHQTALNRLLVAVENHLGECTTEETQPAADPDDLAQLSGLFTKPGL